MDDKQMLKKMQNDLVKSNVKIINNNDNISLIQKNFNSKYTEDVSDSDDDLTSYKNRNSNIINKVLVTKINNNLKIKKTQKSKKIDEELEEIEKELENNDKNKNKKNDKNKKNTNEDEDIDIDQDKDDEGEDEDEQKYEYTEEFAKKVKQYVKNDDRIRELQTELKLLNTAKKTAEADILKHLERLGESNINITGGKLRINQYESKEGLKEDIVKQAIAEEGFKDPKIIEKIFDKINQKRTANGKIQLSLKRTFERGGTGNNKDKKK